MAFVVLFATASTLAQVSGGTPIIPSSQQVNAIYPLKSSILTSIAILSLGFTSSGRRPNSLNALELSDMK